jgi:hypothetical protein
MSLVLKTVKGKNVFSWGDKPDLGDTLEEDIIFDKAEPVPVNSLATCS